jgi:ribose/xylose/arabinose/galactoside ABC-type transport system permease subunit
LFVLAFVKNALGLVAMTPEQQDIVTGAVLVGTLIIFGASRNVDQARSWFARLHINRP